MAWDIELTKDVEKWLLHGLDDDGRRQIVPAIDMLEEVGPMLGRPVVDRIKGSRHHNMKELRSTGGSIRILFVFDPKRKAILLIGGDKAGQWESWYEKAIPQADDLYDEYLEDLQ
jgi:hypothetical protein